MSGPWAKIGKPETVNLTDIISEEVTRNLQTKKQKKYLKNGVFATDEILVDTNTPVRTVLESISYSTLENNTGIAQRQFYEENDQEFSAYYDFDASEDEYLEYFEEEETDLKWSNKVFHSLKVHLKEEIKRGSKKQNQTTAEFCIEPTNLWLYKVNKVIQGIKICGVISLGENAVILHGETYNSSSPDRSEEYAIKIFRSTLSIAQQYNRYIKNYHCAENRMDKLTTKKIMHLRVKREIEMLRRLRCLSFLCPAVLNVKDDVLVMSLIGENSIPAPKFRNAVMKDVDYIEAYYQVIWTMRYLFQQSGLIHPDLSEENILWQNKKCYFTDLHKCVETDHHKAFKLLYKNCKNITNYFHEKGVHQQLTPEHLLEFITCRHLYMTELLEKLAKVDLHVVKTRLKEDRRWGW